MPIDLTLRSEVSQPLTTVQHDTNLSAIETAVNNLETQVGSSQGSIIGATWDGTGTAIDASQTHDIFLTAPKSGVISSVSVVTLSANGSLVIDVRKNVIASFPPNAGDSIVGATPPTIVSNTKYTDSALVGWNKNITAGDVIGFHLTSSSVFNWIHIDLVYA